MVVIEFSKDDSSILSNGTVILDFYADWCGPCKKYAPEFEKLSELYPLLSFVKINSDENEQIMEKYSVSSLPTTIVLRNGKELERYEGYNLQGIKTMIETYSQ